MDKQSILKKIEIIQKEAFINSLYVANYLNIEHNILITLLLKYSRKLKNDIPNKSLHVFKLRLKDNDEYNISHTLLTYSAANHNFSETTFKCLNEILDELNKIIFKYDIEKAEPISALFISQLDLKRKIKLILLQD